jgi:hypothetical protein
LKPIVGTGSLMNYHLLLDHNKLAFQMEDSTHKLDKNDKNWVIDMHVYKYEQLMNWYLMKCLADEMT